MKLVKLTAKNYRSLRDVSVEFSSLNVFIGANASGKSTILDALRFLQEGVQTRDFNIPVYSRGGFLNLAWKGEPASTIELTVEFEEGDARFEWSVRLNRTTLILVSMSVLADCLSVRPLRVYSVQKVVRDGGGLESRVSQSS